MIAPGSTHASMAELNRSRIIQLLHRDGICSRAHIARRLGLTPAAITKITAQLIDMGVISETGNLDGIKKRRSIGLQLNESKYRVIGVKFARTLVRIGVFDLGGNMESEQLLPPVSGGRIRETLDDVRRRIDAILAADDAIVAIGIAVPGPYLRDEGRIAVVTSMIEWKDVNFIDEFVGAFRVPAFIEQDARAGALAQSLFGSDSDPRSLGYYLVGEGVGLGLIDDGELVNGNLGAATEIGHVSIDIHGRPCECGNVGCLENYCSAVALHQAIIDAGLVDGAKDMTHIDACASLFELAHGGDETALELVRDFARYIGYGCVTIINAYNPAQIVLGDIMAQAGSILLDEVQTVVERHALPALRDTTAITISDLPVDATLSGAAAVAAAQFLEHPTEFVGQPND
ncbi:ROK family protein [Bifidobacterium sp. SMB2]|uniref:ROK family protein n=1 Tax=Bifidobacterium saimiriisciurei TaxID=2661627 RepID=A0ABX0C9L1_9BIFI|nr:MULTISPECIES: ROK family transcriptional regulator [Bifidobacterium]NEG96028.1 ROK family protein [Bifidobacterium sp. SMB2]NEH10894.1 ROK family protein [Bifidobacterium saimiriisciurei]